MTGVAWSLQHWSIGWTAGYDAGERIFWIGPLGLCFEDEGFAA